MTLITHPLSGIDVQLGEELSSPLYDLILGVGVHNIPQETYTRQIGGMRINLILEVRSFGFIFLLRCASHRSHHTHVVDILGHSVTKIQTLEVTFVFVDATHHGLEGFETIDLEVGDYTRL